jgi:hypothetical protein
LFGSVQNLSVGPQETSGPQRLTVPFPEPQFLAPYGATYGLADCIDCLDGKLDEPKNSG